MKVEKCERDDAKTFVIAIINGSEKYKSPTLLKLSKEIKLALKFINNLPEYASISEFVKKTFQADDNIF